MGNRQHAASVIASLMGLEDPTPKMPTSKRQRVLSENYLRNTASIGLHEGSSTRFGRACSRSSTRLQGTGGTSKLQRSNDKHGTQSTTDKHSSSSIRKVSHRSQKPAGACIIKRLPETPHEDLEIFSRKRQQLAPRNVLRPLQKLEKVSVADRFAGIHDMNQSLKSQLETVGTSRSHPTKIALLRPNFVKAKTYSRFAKSAGNSRSRYTELGESLRPESGGVHHHRVRDKAQVVKDLGSLKSDLSACKGNMDIISQQERHESNSGEISRLRLMGKNNVVNSHEEKPSPQPGEFKLENQDHSPLSLPTKSKAAKKQIFERWKPAKKVQEVGVAEKSRTLGIRCAAAEYESVAPESMIKLSKSGICPPSKKNDTPRDVEHNVRFSGLPVDTISLENVVNNTLADARKANVGVPSTSINIQQFEPNASPISSVKDDHSSRVSETSTAKVSLKESLEEESHSNSFRLGLPQFHRNFQHSPDSVLEAFGADNASNNKCFDDATTDFGSLSLQLQILKSELEEPASEEGIMAVSSDEDTEKDSIDLSEGFEKLLWFLQNKDHRNFSYLVDVLDEAGVHGIDLAMDMTAWYSIEAPLSPMVFEALEKKYQDQTSWKKSERRLLFDCINLGLGEIINPFRNFRALTVPVRRRCTARLKRDMVEEELWMSLTADEKEKSKDMSQKALGREMKWLELEEDIDTICRDLEIHLFDDLVMELASMLSE